jgi:hypothetical protein
VISDANSGCVRNIRSRKVSPSNNVQGGKRFSVSASFHFRLFKAAVAHSADGGFGCKKHEHIATLNDHIRQ